MSDRLDSKPQIWKLAVDLGLPISEVPTRAILRFTTDRVRKAARKYSCASLGELLNAVAAEVGTVFEEIRSDSELLQVCLKYVGKGESAFANLENELKGDRDYAITIKRVHRQRWEPQFVSIIDCRGDKAFRSYFSKWHELAHLLTLTPQMRLVFRRTHSASANLDPEERLMDIIAGETGFLPDLLPGNAGDDISFEMIQKIREEHCPDASWQSAIIGVVKAMPRPCVLIEAKMALRKSEAARVSQMVLNLGIAGPVPALRAVHVTVNGPAREIGVGLHRNWRVPKGSVIARVFETGGYLEALEDLNWWETSDGSRLAPCPVVVKAKKTWDAVVALLIPQAGHSLEPQDPKTARFDAAAQSAP
jgi:hypothetical protein